MFKPLNRIKLCARHQQPVQAHDLISAALIIITLFTPTVL